MIKKFYKQSITWITVGLLAFTFFAPAVAQAAFNTNDLRSLNGQTPFYLPGDTAKNTCGAGASTLIGSETTEKVYNYLIEKGLTPPQAAGVMGNLQEESGINPRRVQGSKVIESDVMKIDGKTGYGLIQWTSLGRQQGLKAAITAAGVKDSDLDVQLNQMWKEMNSSEFYENGFARLKATSDYTEATSLFMLHFERPRDQSLGAQKVRWAHALKWMTKYGSTTPAAMPANTNAPPVVGACGTVGATNNTSGGYSLPTTEDFYIKNKVEFDRDHHLSFKDGSQSPGADIPMPEKTPIYSMSAGKITKAPNGSLGKNGGYGLGVTVDAGDGVMFVYGHGIDGGAYPNAKEGDIVKAGQQIMNSGNTGSSTGPHLHVSIVVNGQQRCPQTFFAGIFNKNVPNVKSLPSSGCSSGN